MSDLKQQLREGMKTAMREKATFRLGVIRLMINAIKQKEIDDRVTLGDSDVLVVLDKQIKQRKDSVEQFKAAQRDDLAQQEIDEIAVIQSFMPQPLSADEIEQLLSDAIRDQNATSIKDMGKVIATLRPKVQGRVDMGQLSQQVKAKLSQAS